MPSAASLAYAGFRTAAKDAGSLASRYPGRTLGAVAGLGLGLGTAGFAVLAPIGAAYEARRASTGWKREQETSVMSNLLANAQVGPFGTGNRPYGMGSNYGGAADMTLALHYARNGTGIRDPFFQLAGRFGRAGRFVGDHM